MKWSYCVLWTPNWSKEFEKKMNELGERGWELCATIGKRLVFKKQSESYWNASQKSIGVVDKSVIDALNQEDLDYGNLKFADGSPISTVRNALRHVKKPKHKGGRKK